MTNEVFLLLILFSIKHFIVDFPLQKPYQWMNKGTYGHPGGILHAGLHSAGTFLVVYWFTDPISAMLASVVDGVVHYHIDWAKMNLNKFYGLKADKDEDFWTLLGADQLLHTSTYIFIVYFLCQVK